ncbi:MULTISPECIES: hypothetical protein [Bacillaceae]|uniref:hypothetical protein n=1 Tax=Bacillaceae TaxID=186817 RepID=UPI000479674C|nr:MULTISPECIES: hypothetical protein [Bacillaceae]MBU7591735.1 hypothetical protein [Metabacillus halosaccharovorans]
MIRKGKYASYKNCEFRFTKIEDDFVELVSNNPTDKKIGFKEYSDNVFIKSVLLDEIDKLFNIYPYAIYKGEKFPVSQGKNDKVLLDTSNTELAERFGFKRTDKYLYSKYVLKDEVEIIEDIEPYIR